ncbi:DUF4369 domain-containing protein [Flagellimonas allohymeniacidonis]|uniref:DUF4369 domain-containing protein n=1 Tax=Flagellimonas allohymeniacidonis TaxID=2517819 RepID=A0A4Q8Q8T7_9FLAO|nr:DUF4369 domain-containing protein [Allomuricauda hymeniacidonis]TAI46601.1 DUF4369 domain-containing protein [Allomuricauda hymeniacidonis]
MKRVFVILFLGALLFSCQKESEPNMLISGTIKGLKKGTLYFQKPIDSTLVNIDSLEIKGDGSFSFGYNLESPEIFYLYLKKQDNNDINDRITFFGEEGTITINTSWNTFDVDPEIKGSQSQEKLSEFTDMLSQFNIKELQLMQQTAVPEISKDSTSLDSIQKLIAQNIVNRYRYTLNFGLNNGDSYVTPYAMLTEGREANPKYLDSVYGALSQRVLESKYGKEFKEFLGK